MVPQAAYPQSLNRYSYVINSPLNYRDPSGHVYDDWKDCSGSAGKADCWKYNQEKNLLENAGVTWDVLNEKSQDTAGLLAALTKSFGIQFSGNFSWSEVGTITQGIAQTARAVGLALGSASWMERNGASVFRAVYSSVFGTTMVRMSGEASLVGGSAMTDLSNIYLWNSAFYGGDAVNRVIHEFGHNFDFKYLGTYHLGDIMLGSHGFQSDLLNDPAGYSLAGGFGPFYPGDALGVERFADMFLGYAVGGFDLTVDKGQYRDMFMKTHMPDWLHRFYP
jgi:hypothetical protein